MMDVSPWQVQWTADGMSKATINGDDRLIVFECHLGLIVVLNFTIPKPSNRNYNHELKGNLNLVLVSSNL